MPPIMQLDRGHVRWRKIRIPLLAGTALLVLLGIAVLVGFWLRSAGIRSAVREARASAALDTVEGLRSAVSTLEKLAADYPQHGDVQAANAYVLALDALRHGPVEPGLGKARKALGRSEPESGGDLYYAASILVALVEGRLEEAGKAVSSLPGDIKPGNELKFARALVMMATDRSLEAQVDLGIMATGGEPFLPAVTALGKLRHADGNLDAAAKLLTDSIATHPGRLDASIERILVLVDMGTDASLGEADKALADLGDALDRAPPVLVTRGLYARGMLLMARGKYAEASGPLCEARTGMIPRDLAVARCARARRLSGDAAGAYEVLADLQFGESTPTLALLEMVEASLALWRPRSASLALDIVSARPDVPVGLRAMLAGTRAMQAGEMAEAARFFEQAGETADAPVLAALAYLEAGDGKSARKVLQGIVSGPAAGCASALLDWSRGSLESALQELTGAEACTLSLKVRFLSGLGRSALVVETLEKAGPVGPDLGVRLARALYRVKGRAAAKEALDRVRSVAAESVPLLRSLAEAYAEAGYVDEARGVGAEGVDRNPGKPEALALECRILRLTGDGPGAAKAAAAALGAHEGHAGLLVERAYGHLADKEWEQAADLGRKAMVPGPWYLDAAIVTARALEAMGRTKDAEEVLREAGPTLLREYDPILAPGAWAELLRLKHERGGPEIKKARVLFTGLLKREIPDPMLYYEGALILLADGRQEEALEKLHSAAALDPSCAPPFKKLSAMGVLTEDEGKTYTTVHGEAP